MFHLSRSSLISFVFLLLRPLDFFVSFRIHLIISTQKSKIWKMNDEIKNSFFFEELLIQSNL